MTDNSKTKVTFAIGGQIADATLVSAPKQRNTQEEKEAIKEGNSAKEIWPDELNKAAQKDVNARSTLKVSGKTRYWTDGSPLPAIATPTFDYKSQIAIDRRCGFILQGAVNSAVVSDGRMLGRLVTTDNTSGEVWADSVCRSKANEIMLANRMLRSQIHRKKPRGKSMPQAESRANAKKSIILARVEHVLARKKQRFGLLIRTIGLARAEAKMKLANLAYNFHRLVFHERRKAKGWVCQKAGKSVISASKPLKITLRPPRHPLGALDRHSVPPNQSLNRR